MAYVRSDHGEQSGKTHRLESRTVFGRSRDCDIVLSFSSISRYHASVTEENGRYFLEDMGSRNGTFLNGRPVQEKEALSDGDLVQLSTLSFVFFDDRPLADRSVQSAIVPNSVAPYGDASDFPSEVERSLLRHEVAPGAYVELDSSPVSEIPRSSTLRKISVVDVGIIYRTSVDAEQKLRSLMLLNQSLRQATSPGVAPDAALGALFEDYPNADTGVIGVRLPERSGVEIVAAACRPGAESHTVEFCVPLIDNAMSACCALLSVDASRKSTEIAEPGIDNLNMRSLLSVPLLDAAQRAFGVIQLSSENPDRHFTPADLDKLILLSHSIATVLENMRRFNHELQRHLKLGSEQLYAQIQARLLPRETPQLPGYVMTQDCFQASGFAGDTIDSVRLPDGRVACLMLDVSGRHTDAAEQMVAVSRLLLKAVFETSSAAMALCRLSEAVLEQILPEERMISAAVMILDAESHHLELASLGNCRSYAVENGEVSEISGSIGIGSAGLVTKPTDPVTLTLAASDSIVCFTNGIAEIDDHHAPAEEPFSPMKILRDSAADGNDLGQSLHRELDGLRTDRDLFDDLCFTVIQRLPDRAPGRSEAEPAPSSPAPNG